jgi:glycosyltransferase involved in cell wall biosynthesis
LLFARARLTGLSKIAGADLIHCPANFCSGRSRIPQVLTVHDLSFLRHPEWFRVDRAAYYSYAIRRSVRLARRIIADSRATATDLESLLGVSPARIDVVPLGVGAEFQPATAERVDAVRKQYDLPEAFFLYVGTHEPRKNLARLVEAWNSIADEYPQDLVLAGRAGWKSAHLTAAIAASPHAARIHRPGYVPRRDLPALLSAADAFVYPSLFEGFGLPPLEAMACGTPVLTSATSSLPEVVGNAAVLVDPTDIASIADGLLRVLAEATALRQHGPQRAAAFTWERCAAATIAIYRAALS